MIKGLLHGERVFFFLIIAFFSPLPMTGHTEDEVSKFPTRPVIYIHPYAAGFPVSIAVNLISKEAEKFLGQPIVVMNKPGAGGTVGVTALATAFPDGYTIGNTPQSSLIITPYLETLPYHP